MFTLYRALHENKLLPANVIPSKNVCNVSYCNLAHNKFDFEVLSGVGFYWVECSNGDVPEGAVNASDGTGAIYVGRTKYEKSLVIGRISTEDRCIYVPYDKREFEFPCYEVLCVPQKGLFCVPNVTISSDVFLKHEMFIFSSVVPCYGKNGKSCGR